MGRPGHLAADHRLFGEIEGAVRLVDPGAIDLGTANTSETGFRDRTIPGMGHVTGVFNARVSSLETLEAWVEKGQAPGDMLATDANKDTQGRSRPVCQYPAWPHYDGTGDINSAKSFSCQN